MALQSHPTTDARKSVNARDDWMPLPQLDAIIARDLNAWRRVVNRILKGDRAAVRALVVELDGAHTLIEAMTAIKQLEREMDVVSRLLALAQMRINAAIMMGPQPGERSTRAKRKAA